MSKAVHVHTDGSCLGNPGPGGWAAIVQHADGRTEELSGGEADTTNNRMEMLAAIKALEALPESSSVVLVTDSKYLRNGITEWIHSWKRKNWKNAKGDPVKNKDLWQTLETLIEHHDIQWEWVKGHAGHRLNERCDDLAREAAERMA